MGDGMTEYERERAENIRRNQEQLEKLGLLSSKPLLQTNVQRKPTNAKRKTKDEITQAPKRVSLRQRNQDPDGAETQPTEKEIAMKQESEKEISKRISGTIKLEAKDFEAFSTALPSDEDRPIFIKNSVYKDLSISLADGSVKVTRDMIYAVICR
jgi:hypothetical protein